MVKKAENGRRRNRSEKIALLHAYNRQNVTEVLCIDQQTQYLTDLSPVTYLCYNMVNRQSALIPYVNCNIGLL